MEGKVYVVSNMFQYGFALSLTGSQLATCSFLQNLTLIQWMQVLKYPGRRCRRSCRHVGNGLCLLKEHAYSRNPEGLQVRVGEILKTSGRHMMENCMNPP